MKRGECEQHVGVSYRNKRTSVFSTSSLLLSARSTNNSQCQSAVIGARNKMWVPHCRGARLDGLTGKSSPVMVYN